MSKFQCSHTWFPEHVVRRMVKWISGEIGLTSTKGLTIIVGPKRSAHRGYNGWYRHRQRRVEAYIGVQITYPIGIGHNRSEEGRVAADPFELLVRLLAHELEHARVYRAVYPDRAKLKVLNHEPRVRAVDYRVLLAFRAHRDELLTEWLVAPAPRPAPKPKPTKREMADRRAVELLRQWERRLKLATGKVSKYRRRVARLAIAATRCPDSKKPAGSTESAQNGPDAEKSTAQDRV
jgi:hypothetical protein